MSIIPKILYHGTSMRRWFSIQRDGIMKCNMRSEEELLHNETGIGGLVLDPNRALGYLYFSDNINESYEAGLMASLIDMRYYRDTNNKAMEEMAIKYRDIAIIALKTSNIRDRIDIDPEIIGAGHQPGNENTLWYRVKGDIKTKHLLLYRHVDFNTFEKYDIDCMIKRQELMINAKRLMKKNPHLTGEIIWSMRSELDKMYEELELQGKVNK